VDDDLALRPRELQQPCGVETSWSPAEHGNTIHTHLRLYLAASASTRLVRVTSSTWSTGTTAVRASATVPRRDLPVPRRARRRVAAPSRTSRPRAPGSSA
jgi:hypothetical protein